MPHDFNNEKFMGWSSISKSLLKWNKFKLFLKRLTTSDKRCGSCMGNIVVEAGEAPQTVSKIGLSSRKVMLLWVWWEWNGIVHYRLLLSDQTIDYNLYSQQLERLYQVVEIKWLELINRKDVIFHHNARFHTFLVNHKKLRKLGWEVLMHSMSRSCRTSKSENSTFVIV